MAQNVKPGDQQYSLTRNDPEMARIYDVASKDIQSSGGLYLVKEKMKVARGDRVIDFGCGPGNLDFEIADIVKDEGYVFAFDPLLDCITIARQKLAQKYAKYAKIVRFEQGRAEEVPKSAGTDYDHALMSAMIHWTNRDETLEQAFSVLRKGGCAGVGTACGDVISPLQEIKRNVLSQKAYWRLDPEEGIPDYPTEIELKSSLAKAGFIDIQSEVITKRFVWANAEATMQWIVASCFDNYIPRGPKNISEDGRAEIEVLRQAAREEIKSRVEEGYRMNQTDENDKRIAMNTKSLFAWGYKG